jgi:hypothetical protein
MTYVFTSPNSKTLEQRLFVPEKVRNGVSTEDIQIVHAIYKNCKTIHEQDTLDALEAKYGKLYWWSTESLIALLIDVIRGDFIQSVEKELAQ